MEDEAEALEGAQEQSRASVPQPPRSVAHRWGTMPHTHPVPQSSALARRVGHGDPQGILGDRRREDYKTEFDLELLTVWGGPSGP